MSVVLEKELPKGWIHFRLDEVFEFNYGKSLSEKNRDNGKFPVYGSSGIIGSHSIPLTKEKCLVIGRKGSAGEVHRSLTPCWAIDTSYFVYIDKELDFDFFYYLFKHKKNQFTDNSTAVPSLVRDVAYKIILPLPPLNEQKRIVAKIEELFSLLDSTKQLLENIKNQLKQYRQSLLQQAFKGKLVSQDQNDKHASIFLEKITLGKKIHLNEKQFLDISELVLEKNKILPDSWIWTNLLNIARQEKNAIVDGPFGSNLKNSDYSYSGTIPVLTITILYDISKIHDARKITKIKFEQIKRSKIEGGDILIAKIGSTYGLTCIYPEHYPVAMIPANLCKITPNTKIISKEFLKFWLDSFLFKTYLDTIVSYTAQPAFGITKLKQLPIPLPPLNEQKRIVAKIEESLSLIEKNEKFVDLLLLQHNSIKHSVLKQAFEGKLVPQDPNDEPVEILLQKITEEKQKIINQTKRGKKNDK